MMCNVYPSLLLLLVLLSSSIDGNYICIETKPQSKFTSVEERLSDEARILVSDHKVRKRFETIIQIENTTITEDMYLDMVLKSLEVDPINTIYKFQDWYVPRFLLNKNVLMLDFNIPKDTRELIFIFFAHEVKVNDVAGDCKSQDVELVLRPQAYPISNISMPERFSTGGENKYHIFFESDGVAQTVKIDFPIISTWYARVYQTWRNPNDDTVAQKGTVPECYTHISGQVSVDIQKKIKLINCDEIVNITLRFTTATLTDYYKCFISTESVEHDLQLIINLNNEVQFVTLAVDGKKIANKNSNFHCALTVGEELIQNITVKFTPIINKWHYLAVIYGKNLSNPSTDNIQLCENLNVALPNKAIVEHLTRKSKEDAFSFEYLTTEIDVVPGDVRIMKFEIYPQNDAGGLLTIETNFPNDTDASTSTMDIVYCCGVDKIPHPNNNKKCQANLVIKEPCLLLTEGKRKINKLNIVHIPYPKAGAWYITLRAFYNNASDKIRVDTRQHGVDYLYDDYYPADGEFESTDVTMKMALSPCFPSECGQHGSCEVTLTGSLTISACKCYSGFTGWLCTDNVHVPSKRVFFANMMCLTLSNLFFIPSIVFAVRRQYYTEAVVYLFTMFFSTFYHACDSNNIYFSYCLTDYSVLQYADFYCGLVSFWVTLVSMASLNQSVVTFLQVIGTILIALGTTMDRFSLILFLIPIVCGFIIIIASWIIHWRVSGSLFPGKYYLLIFFPAGVLLATVGLLCFAFFQTFSNYYIVHSIWHIVVAISILLLLPIRHIFYTTDFPPPDTQIPSNVKKILERTVV